MQRVGGTRRKTRHKLAKNKREKGKINLTKFFQKFKEGDKVCLKAEPAYQKGMYFPRYHGRAGTIIGKKGKCYEVKFKDIKKEKTAIIHPVHLKRI